MSVRLRLVLVAAIAMFSLAAFAASATANVYCVQVTTCTYGGETGDVIEGLDSIPGWEITEGSGPHVLVLGDVGGPIVGTGGIVSETERFDVVAEPGSSPIVQHTGGSISTLSFNSPGCVISGIEVEVPDLVNGRALYTNCDVSNVKIF